VGAGGAIVPPAPAEAQIAAVLAPLARRAIAAGAPVTAGSGQDEMLALAGIKSALCAPVLSRGRVAACLCAIHTGVADLFAEDEKRLAQFVTTLAGAALENAEGFAELAVANREREVGLLALNGVQQQLAVAGRMATVGTLAAGVAHEINNPLQYVITNLTVALEELAAMEQTLADIAPAAGAKLARSVRGMREGLVDASDGAGRVRQIVRDLRTFTREADVRTPVDVRRVLDSVVSMARAEIHHRALLVRAYEDVPPVLANEAQLGQVFLNLLLNAAQAIPEGASGRNEIRVRARADGGKVIIEVIDTGAGMPPEVVERIFDPFFTTKAVGQGMGLGLSICHGIVAGLGGTIEVASEVGRGTTMRVVLPATAGTDAAAPPSPSHDAPTGPQPRGVVVVIDDEPLVSEAISGLIGREHEVAVAHDGVTGIELVLGLTVEVDMILCDLMMPRMTGSELYAELRRRRPGMEEKLVFMTGGAFTAAARAFLASVPNLCLDKPIEAAALREHIRARVAARMGSKA
jgi:signal transduction histidine kinase/CheY-like chemotaxis protein